ncbi:MAG: pyrrolysine--tRNA(Pyl) ligase small subunit [Desulfobacula sp.]|jgi:pyrrolysyl-tRNA synthetase-like protein|nr:pyrrolysine--tRNA(Pyl) ligase small subunit [Desulfobacula sp.]
MSGKKKPPPKKFYRKRIDLLRLIEKIKLWPSRRGILHGIKYIEKHDTYAIITTHCNKTFPANNSRNSRAARWVRNKWFHSVCKSCGVPDWKLEKYSVTQFRRHHGSNLLNSDTNLPNEKSANEKSTNEKSN